MNEPATTWIEGVERRTRLSRLLVAAPERAYDELRAYAKGLEHAIFGDPDLEEALLERGEPLIDLGLASFATAEPVVARLWKRASEHGYQDERVGKGIRVACLANCSLREWRFPLGVVGEQDIQSLFANADEDELQALLCNGRIWDDLLVALYERKEPFTSLPDERWRRLVMLSRGNPRLVSRQDGEDAPDLGFYHIQKAIFRLLEIAPLDPYWVITLYDLLDSLDPSEIFHPTTGQLSPVLTRWKNVAVTDYKGSLREGQYTSLPFTEEFRCLIGAIFGRSFDEGRFVDYGSSDSDDVADRCAYYANAKLEAKDIAQFRLAHGLECELFHFSVVYNTAILLTPDLRKLTEEVCGGGEFAKRYKRRCALISKKYPNFNPHPTADWLVEDGGHQPSSEAISTLPDIDLLPVLQSILKWQRWTFWLALALAFGALLISRH